MEKVSITICRECQMPVPGVHVRIQPAGLLQQGFENVGALNVEASPFSVAGLAGVLTIILDEGSEASAFRWPVHSHFPGRD